MNGQSLGMNEIINQAEKNTHTLLRDFYSVGFALHLLNSHKLVDWWCDGVRSVSTKNGITSHFTLETFAKTVKGVHIFLHLECKRYRRIALQLVHAHA